MDRRHFTIGLIAASTTVPFVPPAQAQDVLGSLLEFGKSIGKSASTEFGPADEYYIGREAASRLIGNTRLQGADSQISQYLTQVGTTLALGSNAPYLYKPYTFLVLQDDTVNAFAAPGGIVLVTRGMLRFLQDEDELAFILGHELGHIEMEHGLIAIAKERQNQAARAGVSAAASIAASRAGAGGDVLQTLSARAMDGIVAGIRDGYSVDIEAEADRRGVAMMAKAGYDVRASGDILERFRSFRGNYGGAGYPEQRGPQLVQFRQEQRLAGSLRSPQRTNRYRANVAAALAIG